MMKIDKPNFDGCILFGMVYFEFERTETIFYIADTFASENKCERLWMVGNKH